MSGLAIAVGYGAGSRLAEHLDVPEDAEADLARALASQPKVLLLDELASGLTERELEPLMKIIAKIRDQGITILMVTHEDEIAAYARRLIRMRDGKIEDDTTRH